MRLFWKKKQEASFEQYLSWAKETVQAEVIVDHDLYWSWNEKRRRAYVVAKKLYAIEQVENQLKIFGDDLQYLLYKVETDGIDGVVNVVRYLRKLRNTRKKK